MSIYKRERGLVSGRKAGGTEMILVQFFAELLYNASPSFIVERFLKPHLHSWPLVSPLPSFVHLSTSKQKPWVHAVLERHLVDTFKAFRLYNLSFFVVIFRVYFMILCFSTHSYLVHWYRFSCLFFLFPFIPSFDWSQF